MVLQCLVLCLICLNWLLAYTFLAATLVIALKLTAANTSLMSIIFRSRSFLNWSIFIGSAADVLERALRYAEEGMRNEFPAVQRQDQVPLRLGALAPDVEVQELIEPADLLGAVRQDNL